MTTVADDLAGRVAELEARVAELEARWELNTAADGALEQAVRDRLPLEHTLRLMMPILIDHVEAEAVVVRTFDETLQLRAFPSEGAAESMPAKIETVAEVTDRREPYMLFERGLTVLGQHLDVAGELFGTVAVSFAGKLDGQAERDARVLIDTWCEELDNYLAAIAQARRKHRALGLISNALKEPVLDVGIDRAIDALRDHVHFEDLLLVFRHEEDVAGVSLHYKIIQEGELTHDSRLVRDVEVDEFIRTQAAKMISGKARDLLARFGITRFREEVLINGIRDERVLGRLVVANRKGEFDTFDRDLLERFADTLRQRIVDFNKEWKHLSLCFSPATVHRLLNEEDYKRRFLAPSEQGIAMMYCDISGFTRLSEQVLVDPALVGKLINRWSQTAVDLIWDSGGVFDKMVGDCIIGLWGPPFHDIPAQVACRRAAETARRVREHTESLGSGADFPQLRKLEEPVGVATGLSWSRAVVGLFGPNENYTAFGSGMNNTARLQGVAKRGEILCMDAFVAAHGDAKQFGEERAAQVKNVAEPLRFRSLR